jgi:hypothetical protein
MRGNHAAYMQSTHAINTQAEVAQMRAYYAAIADKYLPAVLDF